MAQEFPTVCGLCASPPEQNPEGLVLIRDSYQFGDAKLPMTGFTPDSPGPHKLIVVLSGQVTPHRSAFAVRRKSLEKTVAVQGHGMVVVETPDFESYPDYAGAAELFAGNLSGARDLMCAD